MTEAEWLACEDAREMIQCVLHSESARKLRLFAIACCRCSRQLMRDKKHRCAVEIAERSADGQATEKELNGLDDKTNTRAQRLYNRLNSERVIRRWSEASAVANVTKPFTQYWHASNSAADAVWHITRAAHRNIDKRLVALLRDIFSNPFRPVPFSPSWRTDTEVPLARQMYAAHDFSAMPILADALQDAGCDSDDILTHCRDDGPMTKQAGSTQRLPRSSRTPGLRLPPAKAATAVSARVTTASAVRAGSEKKAENGDADGRGPTEGHQGELQNQIHLCRTFPGDAHLALPGFRGCLGRGRTSQQPELSRPVA
jgi:hypothetical protein